MKNIFLSFLTAIIASFLFAIITDQPAGEKATEKESAYNRVLRTGELRCAYVNWYPYFILDPNKGALPSGINVEITEAIGKTLDLKIRWSEEVGWGNLVEGLNTHRYDAVCTSVWPDAPKIKHLALSEGMFYDTLYAYVRANDNRFDGNLDKINSPDNRIAAIDGGSSYEIAKSAFPKAKIVALAQNVSTAEGFLNVTAGKADVIITSPDEFHTFNKNNPGQMKRVENAPPVRTMPMVMSFGPGEEKLRDRINYALQMLVDNGDIAKIVRKYSTDYILRAPSHHPAP
ncbi:MAG: substrate-binding periplasmic protein [Dongiaceae bacterium]